MKTVLSIGGLVLFAVGAWAAEPVSHEHGPKNLVSPSYRAPANQPAVAHELTKRDVKKLIATAETKADHLRVAGFYKAEAAYFEARGTAYEQAATSFRNGPAVKNFASPTTSGRWDFLAKGFRDQAAADRALAAAHEEMAREVARL